MDSRSPDSQKLLHCFTSPENPQAASALCQLLVLAPLNLFILSSVRGYNGNHVYLKDFSRDFQNYFVWKNCFLYYNYFLFEGQPDRKISAQL